MARVLWLVVAMVWLIVALRFVRGRRRSRPDRRLLLALETLRNCQVTTAVVTPSRDRIPWPRTGTHDAAPMVASR